MVENTPEACVNNKENVIPVSSWFDNPNDEELLNLIPILEQLALVKDVRVVISKTLAVFEEHIGVKYSFSHGHLQDYKRVIGNYEASINERMMQPTDDEECLYRGHRKRKAIVSPKPVDETSLNATVFRQLCSLSNGRTLEQLNPELIHENGIMTIGLQNEKAPYPLRRLDPVR